MQLSSKIKRGQDKAGAKGVGTEVLDDVGETHRDYRNGKRTR